MRGCGNLEIAAAGILELTEVLPAIRPLIGHHTARRRPRNGHGYRVVGRVKRNSGEIDDFIWGYGNGDGGELDVIDTGGLRRLRQLAGKHHDGRHEREPENCSPASRQFEDRRHAHPSCIDYKKTAGRQGLDPCRSAGGPASVAASAAVAP
jgi:hypothetical protein